MEFESRQNQRQIVCKDRTKERLRKGDVMLCQKEEKIFIKGKTGDGKDV